MKNPKDLCTPAILKSGFHNLDMRRAATLPQTPTKRTTLIFKYAHLQSVLEAH